jgi:hypothetical protein
MPSIGAGAIRKVPVIPEARGSDVVSDAPAPVQSATTLFELAIGQIMVRYVLAADGFDAPSQADFVDNTLLPALTTHDTNTDTEDRHDGHR